MEMLLAVGLGGVVDSGIGRMI